MTKQSKKIKRSLGYRGKRKKATDRNNVSSGQNLFQQALTLHQTGRISEAERIYRQILTADPENPDALHYLGMLAHQVGKNKIAVELISRAIKCRPDYVNALNNLGIILTDQGLMDEAIACFMRALSLKPDYAEVHFNLGNALKEVGKNDKAIASYRQALSLKPDYAEALNNMGIIFRDQKIFDKAVACFKKALSVKPDYVEAQFNLGNVFMDLGMMDDASAGFKRVLSFSPDYEEALINLGSILKDQGRLEEAAACFQRVISLKPDFAEMHYNLGVIYRESGRLEDAETCYRKALSLQSGYAAAFKDLTSIVHYTEADADIRVMEALYNKEGIISEDDRIVIGFALGKVFEDLGDYGKSFAYIHEANQLYRRTFEYSIQNETDIFRRISKMFSAQFFSGHYVTGNPDRTPIFIIGMPRSGTTLVEQILASHPLVFGAGELPFLSSLINSLCSENATVQFPECMTDLDLSVYRKMGADYIEQIRKYTGDAQYITDKMPYNFLHVGIIKTILPGAKIIHCTRNPMDTCLSLYKNFFKEQHGYAYDLVELGQYYNLYRDLMGHWEKVLSGFMFTVRYEELVADQKNRTKNLLDFCNLPWDEACLAFHKTERMVATASLAQVRKPIYKDSVELWKRYEKQLEPLRKTIYDPK